MSANNNRMDPDDDDVTEAGVKPGQGRTGPNAEFEAKVIMAIFFALVILTIAYVIFRFTGHLPLSGDHS